MGLACPSLSHSQWGRRSAPGLLDPTTPLCFLNYRAADTLKGGATVDTAQVFNVNLGEKPLQRNPQDSLTRTQANAGTLLSPAPTIPWSSYSMEKKMDFRSEFESSSVHTPQRLGPLRTSVDLQNGGVTPSKGVMSHICFPPRETQNSLNKAIHEDTCKVWAWPGTKQQTQSGAAPLSFSQGQGALHMLAPQKEAGVIGSSKGFPRPAFTGLLAQAHSATHEASMARNHT